MSFLILKNQHDCIYFVNKNSQKYYYFILKYLFIIMLCDIF